MIYKHGKHEIELFDSIHDLPILRFQRFNKYQMIASEIGNTFADFDQREQKAMQFIRKGMKEEALQEMENRRQAVFNAFNEFTPIGKSFAILVKRINSKNYETFTPDNLDVCLEHLERIGLGNKSAIDKLQEVKKKIETELVVYFPVYFPKNENTEMTALRVKRINSQLDSIINPEVSQEENTFSIEREILEHDKPNIWNVHKKGNMERVLEVDFQKFGISVTQQTGTKLEEMSTFKFYASVEFLTEKNSKNKN